MPWSIIPILKYLSELSVEPLPPPLLLLPLPAIVPIPKLMCTLGGDNIPDHEEQNHHKLNAMAFLVTSTIV
jgi:hypothetical protein